MKNFSINKVYYLLGIIIIALAVVVTSFTFYKFRKNFLKIHLKNQYKLINDFSRYFEEKFLNQIEFLKILKFGDDDNVYNNIEYFGNIFLVDSENNEILKIFKSKLNPEILKKIDFSILNNLPLIRLKTQNNIYITPLYYSKFLGKKVISVVIPWKDDKLIVGELDFSKVLRDIFKEYANREDIIIIADLKNNFLESSHPNLFFKRLNFTEIKLNNKIYTAVEKVIPDINLKVFYLSPLAISLQILFQNVLIIIFVLLLMLFCLYFFSTKYLLIHPLTDIVLKLEDYPDKSINVKTKIKEILLIQNKFNEARDKIADILNAQKKLLNFLENIFQSSPLPIFIIDKEMNILFSNLMAKKVVINENFLNFIEEKLKKELQDCIEKRDIVKKYDIKFNGKIFDVIFSPLILNNREEVVCILNDQTEKKALQDKIIEMKKMETVSLFASGLAHDFNNVIQSVLAGIEIMEYSINDKEKVSKYLRKTKRNIEVAINLLQRLRSYMKRKVVEKVDKVDFKEVILDSLVITKVSIPYSIKVTENFDKNENYYILGDKYELIQVMMNLILNAKDAIIEAEREEGKIEIILEKKDGKVFVSIKDNGIGIKEKDIDKIFQVFYSSKGYVTKEKGTGVGLSITKKIIEKYDGKIEIFSDYGKGTTFKITFPLAN